MSLVRRPGKTKKGGGLNFSCQKRKRSLSDGDTRPARTFSIKQSGQPTRLLFMSDTHGASHLLHPINNSDVDVIIHCGDLSDCGELEDYRNTISLLKSIPADLKLVIPGNHDLTLDRSFWSNNCTSFSKSLHKQAIDLWKSKETTDAGIVFLNDGIHEFALKSGAKFTVYACSATPQAAQVTQWAFGYPSNVDRFNPAGSGIWYGECKTSSESEISITSNIDIMMTHGPPKYILDSDSHSGDSIGCAHLFRGARRAQPRIHAFGHAHSGYGASTVSWKADQQLPRDDEEDDGIQSKKATNGLDGGNVNIIRLGENTTTAKETLFINSALMDDNHRISNVPWLVELTF